MQGRWLARLAAGDAIAALAVTDPRGADRVQAAPADHGWSLSGTKLAVPFGVVADVLVVSVDLDQPALVVVAADAPGVSRSRHDTFAPEPFAVVTLTDVAVGADDVVGDRAVLTRALAHQTVVDTAYAVGLAGGALGLAIDHATNREQFGRPIGVNQAVSHQCVDMRVEIDAMRVLALQAAWRLDRHDTDPAGATRAVALAPTRTHATCCPASSPAPTRCTARIGFTMEYDLQLFTRRAKAYELAGGGVAGHLEQVARCLGL